MLGDWGEYCLSEMGIERWVSRSSDKLSVVLEKDTLSLSPSAFSLLQAILKSLDLDKKHIQLTVDSEVSEPKIVMKESLSGLIHEPLKKKTFYSQSDLFYGHNSV